MKRLLTEPLVHFLLLGAALFGVFTFVAEPEEEDISANREIVVTPGRIEMLAANFAKVWQRPPSDTELTGLIEDFIREEIFYREALALGMDRDDTIIRRRLRQKLEFITTDLADQIEPTEADLQATLEGDPETYRIDPVVSFEQVFIDPKKHGDDLEQVLSETRVQITAAKSPDELAALGDRLMIPPALESVSTFEIDRTFGRGFGDEIAALELGQWSEPLRSGYGLHFIRLLDKIDARLPTVDDIRDDLERDWRVQKQKETADAFYTALRDRYTITVEDAPALPQ